MTNIIRIIIVLFSLNLFAGNISFLAPLKKEEIDVIKIIDDYNGGKLSDEIFKKNWQLSNQKTVRWACGEFNRHFLSIANDKKCRLTTGDFVIFKFFVVNPKKQLVRFVCNKQNFRATILNGKSVFGATVTLSKGTNAIVLVYVKKQAEEKEIPFKIINAFTGEMIGGEYFSEQTAAEQIIKMPENTDGELIIKVTEKTSKGLKPSRIYVYDKSGAPKYDYSCPTCFSGFTCAGNARLFLPEGEYTFEIESGKEFLPKRGKVFIKKGKTVTKNISLERVADMNKEGWYAGDLHNHTMIEYTPLLMESEGINIGYVPNRWINPPLGRTAKIELTNFPELIKLKNNRLLYTRVCEDERNDSTLMFFGLPKEVEFPEISWRYPPSVFFAKEFGKISNVWVHLDHLYWWQLPALLACGEIDSIEVINNNFTRDWMNNSEAWGRPRDKNKYKGYFGNAEYQQDIYFKILNSGFRIPPAAGSAACVGGGPFGYNRVYVKIDGEFSWEKWWENLKKGKCFVTCGPLLRVKANGEYPGYVFKAKEEIKISPEIKVDSIDEISEIQVIKNGKIYKTVLYDEFRKAKGIGEITFKKSGWFLIRALTKNKKTYRFAMTAPFYVEIGDKPKRIERSAVEFFLEWAKQAAERNSETGLDKRKYVDEQSVEAIKFWEDLLITSDDSEKETRKKKEELLKELKTKQILVAMWGWDSEIIASRAKEMGYEVVIKPSGNNLDEHKKDMAIWQKYGFKMIVRPHLFAVKDPFDAEQISNGYAELERVIRFHEKNNSNVVGYVIMWGFLGEGGFQPDYKFSEKAKKAFNEYMKTPGEPLPEQPLFGMPGNLRWVEWLKFRSAKLAEFRADYIKFAKKFTDKLVGTWSEFYSVDNYALNMGDAPGSDFLFYDLSFGDVTVNQKIAFAESHGNMETFSTFEKWRDYILPFMAKAAGEGVTPMAFQFPMTRGAVAQGNTNLKKYYVDKIEDEYSLKIGPYMREIIEAGKNNKNEKAEVLLVYDSFEAGAMPADKWHGRVLWPYYFGTKQIESLLRMMGINLRIIPYEWLENYNLTKYKVVIVPDPMYLNKKMRRNLITANKVLYSGEYLLAHRDEKTERGSYTNKFSAKTFDKEYGEIDYFSNPKNIIIVNKERNLMRGVEFPADEKYPTDQMFTFKELPKDAEILASVGKYPIILTTRGGKNIFVANRAFAFAWVEKKDWLEKGLFKFLKNIMKENGVEIRVVSPQQARANLSYVFGSYGVTGNMAWNATDQDIEIEMASGEKITIPKHGWAEIKN